MKILLISTGGTIASQQSAEGLVPMDQGEALAAQVPDIYEIADIDIANVFSKDSSNIDPADWAAIINCIRENPSYDGYVMTHGTDTMAYTAAALSYMIQGSKKPVILTGSQKPMYSENTDSKVNLTDAFLCACSGDIHGVNIVFNGRVIQGTRARKTRSKSFQAFSSINYPDIAAVRGGRLMT